MQRGMNPVSLGSCYAATATGESSMDNEPPVALKLYMFLGRSTAAMAGFMLALETCKAHPEYAMGLLETMHKSPDIPPSAASTVEDLIRRCPL